MQAAFEAGYERFGNSLCASFIFILRPRKISTVVYRTICAVLRSASIQPFSLEQVYDKRRKNCNMFSNVAAHSNVDTIIHF